LLDGLSYNESILNTAIKQHFLIRSRWVRRFTLRGDQLHISFICLCMYIVYSFSISLAA